MRYLHSDISTTMREVSFREVHKQEHVAHHTRETCVHPTINKQPSMYCHIERLHYNVSGQICPHVHFVLHIYSAPRLINADKKTFIQMSALNLQAMGRVIDRGNASNYEKHNGLRILEIICFPLLLPGRNGLFYLCHDILY